MHFKRFEKFVLISSCILLFLIIIDYFLPRENLKGIVTNYEILTSRRRFSKASDDFYYIEGEKIMLTGCNASIDDSLEVKRTLIFNQTIQFRWVPKFGKARTESYSGSFYGVFSFAPILLFIMLLIRLISDSEDSQFTSLILTTLFFIITLLIAIW